MFRLIFDVDVSCLYDYIVIIAKRGPEIIGCCLRVFHVTASDVYCVSNVMKRSVTVFAVCATGDG